MSVASRALVLTLMTSLAGQAEGPPRWYKGNTHTHTVICGHADSSPEDVARWYHDRDYNFLILSEHNHYIDPASVTLPTPARDDFILVPGEEVSGPQDIHSTAMNNESLVAWSFDHENKSRVIQRQVDDTHAASGAVILNHPNWRWALTAADILPVKGLYMFELFNPLCNNAGNAEHPSTEAMWDILLTSGMTMYGVAADDAHKFQTWTNTVTNPGRGWVMVRADALTPGAITLAMERGDFYASSGVRLKELQVSPTRYALTVDTEGTDRSLAAMLFPGRPAVGAPGFTIDFIGPEGKVLHSVAGTTAALDLERPFTYVRAKVSCRYETERGVEAYYAWTQPVFGDGRLAENRHAFEEHLTASPP